jgi:hypothetical protein
MSYCSGKQGAIDPSAGITRNVTTCSNRTILFAFDPTQAWPKEITHGAELDWPRVIADDFHAFRMTSQAMAVLYCMGVGALGAVLIGKVFGAFKPWGGMGVFEFGGLVVSTLFFSFSPSAFAFLRQTECVCEEEGEDVVR